MVLIEEIVQEPELVKPSSASGASCSEQQIGRSIVEAAAGMGPFEPRRARAAAALLEALSSKEEGNACFRLGQYVEALEYYTDAIDAVEDSCEERAVFYGNRAACYANMGMQSDAVADCNAALALRPGYGKVLMRRAKAREALDEPDAALEDMRKIVELAPGTKEALEAAACIPRLEAASNAKMEAQKEEMLGAQLRRQWRTRPRTLAARPARRASPSHAAACLLIFCYFGGGAPGPHPPCICVTETASKNGRAASRHLQGAPCHNASRFFIRTT